MAGIIKHAQRSHKTASNNYSQYRSFIIKSSAKCEKRIAALFHRTTNK